MEIEEVKGDNPETTPTLDNSDKNVNPESPEMENTRKGDSADDTEIQKVERYKQQMEGSKQEAKRISDIHKAYRDVLKDNTVLLKLDKNLAKEVVANLYADGLSFTEDIEEALKSLQGTGTEKPVDEEALVKKVREKILAEQQEEKAQEVLKKALNKFSPEVKKQYLDEFNELIGRRKLTPELAEREIDKIIVYNNREQAKKDKKTNDLLNLASTNLGKPKSEAKTTMTISKLQSLGMPEWKMRATYPELFTK